MSKSDQPEGLIGLEIQLMQIYQAAAKDGGLDVKQMSVQQQVNTVVFMNTAFAYHATLGSDLSSWTTKDEKAFD